MARERMRHEGAAVWQDDPPEGQLLPVFRCCICSEHCYSGGSFPTEEQARNWALLTSDEGSAAGNLDALHKWITEGKMPPHLVGLSEDDLALCANCKRPSWQHDELGRCPDE